MRPTTVTTNEICGIIISCGSREEATPHVAAYIWGPVPTEEEASSKAA
jgi:hypothetical protein